jgi:hypothetical protein
VSGGRPEGPAILEAIRRAITKWQGVHEEVPNQGRVQAMEANLRDLRHLLKLPA